MGVKIRITYSLTGKGTSAYLNELNYFKSPSFFMKKNIFEISIHPKSIYSMRVTFLDICFITLLNEYKEIEIIEDDLNIMNIHSITEYVMSQSISLYKW